MYVCICNAVTERQIRALAEQGICTVDEMSRINGCASTCGSCIQDAEQILNSAQPGRAKLNFGISIVNGLKQAV